MAGADISESRFRVILFNTLSWPLYCGWQSHVLHVVCGETRRRSIPLMALLVWNDWPFMPLPSISKAFTLASHM
jgi:hypothetical protein